MKVGFLDIDNMWKPPRVCGAILLLILMVSAVLNGCYFYPSLEESGETDNSNNTSSISGELDLLHYKEGRLLESRENYAIAELDKLYYCFFYNSTNKHLIKVDCAYPKIPKITTINSHILKLTVNAGASNATRWGYYVDTEKGLISDTFYYLWDETNNLVTYVEADGNIERPRIIVRDIFDACGFWQEIHTFAYPFSTTVEPFSKIEFSDDGGSLEVTYFSGEQHIKVTEIFSLGDGLREP